MNDDHSSEVENASASKPGEHDPERRAIMRSQRGRTRETFWYTVAGYLLIVGLTVASIGIGAVAYQVSFDSGLLLLGLIGFSIIPYPAFLLDSLYLRSTELPWLPQWKLYFGVGAISPILFAILSSYFVIPIEAVGIGLFSLLPVTVVLSVLYLIQRHRYIGVP